MIWIGWLQWQIRTRGYRNHPDEPILRNYHNIECRDAVLAYDEKVPLLDDAGEPVTRWDGETMKTHPVTGEDVPDETARVPVYRYVNPRKAEWPEAEFIVGNPPYIGNKRMRMALGDGYVEALRAAHSDVPETSDYVAYWWNQCAWQLRTRSATRFGLITTNSISQTYGRALATRHLNADPPISFAFVIPDHPWIDARDGAQVRVAMTVLQSGKGFGTLARVRTEPQSSEDILGFSSTHGDINTDFTIGTNLVNTANLRANNALAFRGITLVGEGFIVEETKNVERSILHGLVGARTLIARAPKRSVIDFFEYTEEEAMRVAPAAFQRLLNTVKPVRMQQKRRSYAENWWVFAEPRPALRSALEALHRYIATVETARHRWFTFVDSKDLPEQTLVGIAVADSSVLGLLSSRPHVLFAAAAGSRMGVGNDLRYTIARCFDPFPFPDPDEFTKQRIRNLGEQLDAHRKRQQELHPDLTITGMYNVLEKLRSGEALTAKEKKIHEQGLVSVLKQIHDDLDAAVFDAYGWPHDLSDEKILERLVALNAERAEEERRGIVRWLRPEFQNPSGTAAASQTAIALEETAPAAEAAAREIPEWPKELRDQVSAVRDLFTASQRDGAGWTVQDVARAFRGARRAEVASVLDALASLGILLSFDTAAGRRWRAA